MLAEYRKNQACITGFYMRQACNTRHFGKCVSKAAINVTIVTCHLLLHSTVLVHPAIIQYSDMLL